MLNLNQVADAVNIPNGMRPFFYETVKAMMVLPDFQLYSTSLLPILIRMVLSCEIYVPPREMAGRLVDFFLSQVTFIDGPGGLRVPEFRVTMGVPPGEWDHHATFLAAVAARFVMLHPKIVKERE